MTPEQSAILRKAFPAEMIGKLPKLNCRDCTNSPNKECNRHKKSKCGVCDNWISPGHIHLDYVGHADTTDRLLEADATWYWEPLAIGPDGLPVFDANGGLWIKLTVAGVTRLGYGDSGGKKGANAIKEAIGDAIRNAAMRFGVALELWSKSDRAEAKIETVPQAPDNDECVANAEKLHDQVQAADTKEKFDNAWKAIGAAQHARRIVPEDAEKLRGIWKERKTTWNEEQAKLAAQEINDGG